MLFPSLTIHGIVRYSAIAIKKANVKNVRVRTWAPSLLGTLLLLSHPFTYLSPLTILAFAGLGFIPALPYIFDEPVEHVVDKAFDMIENKFYPDPNSPVRLALKHQGPPHGAEEKAV
jgi:fission process protein 1